MSFITRANTNRNTLFFPDKKTNTNIKISAIIEVIVVTM